MDGVLVMIEDAEVGMYDPGCVELFKIQTLILK